MTRARDLADSADKDIAGTVTLDDITLSNDITLADNGKAIFGAGSDLQIYHDGANSYIQDAGTGALGLFGSTFVGLYETGSGDKMVIANGGGDVELYYDNALKLATTSTGINVTGTAVTDGLTVAGNLSVDGGTIKLDGNYPTGTDNTAFGDEALSNVESGGNYNVAVGNDALKDLTTGDKNTSVGRVSGANITTGVENTSLGSDSLFAITDGDANVAIGVQALNNNTASYNVAVGHQALYDNTSGNYLVAVGQAALGNNTSGIRNSALGRIALGSTTTGNYNSAFGYGALNSNETQSNNTAMGYLALTTATANNNTAVGFESAKITTTGHSNSALGFRSLHKNLTGNFNSAFGYEALYESSSASNNTAVGYQAGYSGTTAEGNTFIGRHAGYSVTSANGNTYIGNNAGGASTSGQNNTILGRFHGNQHGLDIRTSSNNIVLSDGDGNPRMYWYGGSSYPYWEITSGTNAQNTAILRHTGSNPYGPAIGFSNASPNNTTSYFLQCTDSNADRMRIYSNGNVVNTNNSYGAISDQKLKENIVDALSQWDDIKALTVRKYSMKADNLDSPNMLGVIAQEVEAAGMGGLVFESPDINEETKEDLGTVTKQVNYSVLYMKAVKALQEAMDRIETLETKVTALENA